MKPHGVFSTKAEFWIHLLPLDPPHGAVYWYRVAAMRLHIDLTKPAVIYGFSKDGNQTPTGAGFLIPKTTFFIHDAALDPKFCSGFDWTNTTDRERGQQGEQIVAALIDHGVIQLQRQVTTCSRDAGDQFDGVDGSVVWLKKARFEAKTETVRSPNLFVQTHEGRHRPNYTPAGVERRTDMLPLVFKDEARKP